VEGVREGMKLLYQEVNSCRECPCLAEEMELTNPYCAILYRLYCNSEWPISSTIDYFIGDDVYRDPVLDTIPDKCPLPTIMYAGGGT